MYSNSNYKAIRVTKIFEGSKFKIQFISNVFTQDKITCQKPPNNLATLLFNVGILAN